MREDSLREIVLYKSPEEHYIADACIVWCFDARFSFALEMLIAAKRFDRRKCDVISIAGGAKALVSGKYDCDWQFVSDQIQTSLKLHHATRIILMVHTDCGAYEGLAAFGNDTKKEKEFLSQELRGAKKYLETNLGLWLKEKIIGSVPPIDLVFVSSHALYEV